MSTLTTPEATDTPGSAARSLTPVEPGFQPTAHRHVADVGMSPTSGMTHLVESADRDMSERMAQRDLCLPACNAK
jgi:hypothetical protein